MSNINHFDIQTVNVSPNDVILFHVNEDCDLVKTMIYFGKKDAFNNWLIQIEKKEESQNSDNQYSKYSNIIPKRQDISYNEETEEGCSKDGSACSSLHAFGRQARRLAKNPPLSPS